MLRLFFAIMMVGSFVWAQPHPPQPNFFKQGMDHYNAGEYDAAIAAFQKVVNSNPQKPNMQAAQQNPKKPDAFYYIGMCMIKKDNPAGAVSNFSRALDARPGYLQAKLGRGSAYVATKNFDAAIADLQEVIEAQPGNVEAHFQIANAFSYKTDFPQAITHYNRVLEVNPDHAYAHYYVGLAYYKTKDLKQMIDHFEKFLELAPDAPEAPQVKEILTQVEG